MANDCYNGGVALPSGTCECMHGYAGKNCNQKAIRLDGIATYTVIVDESQTNISDIVNKEGFKQYINEVLFVNAISQWTDVTSSLSPKNKVNFFYSAFLPPEDISRVNTTYYNQVVATQLAKPEAIVKAFGDTNAVLNKGLIDIDECYSRLDNCHSNATCLDLDGSFTCNCKEGYQGNGTNCIKIFCVYGKAPPPPAGSQTTVRSFGTQLADLHSDEELPYGTTITYNCSSYYELQNSATKEPFAQAIVCVGTLMEQNFKNSGWSGTIVRCGISNGFRIAIITSVISCILIVTIGSVLVMNKCAEVEKNNKLRKRKHLQEEEFDEVDTHA